MENPFKEINDKLDRLQSAIEGLCLPSPDPLPEEDITDVKGAAKILHTTSGTIYNLVHHKKIPHFKRPGSQKLLFKKTELVKWIDFGRKKTVAEVVDEVNNRLAELKKDPAFKENPDSTSKDHAKDGNIYQDRTETKTNSNREIGPDYGGGE